jgi:hypothetical protein
MRCSEELCDRFFCEQTLSRLQNDVLEVLISEKKCHVIDVEKHECGHRRGPLISIYERMIPREVKKVCCSLIEDGPM